MIGMVDSPWPHYRTGAIQAEGVILEAGLHRPPTLHDDPGPESQRHSERRRISDAAFSVVAWFLADDVGRFVAEIEKVEL